jgi:hypothetical protein
VSGLEIYKNTYNTNINTKIVVCLGSGGENYYVPGFESKSVSCLVMTYSFSHTWEKWITCRVPRIITVSEYWEYQDMQIMLKGDSVLDHNVVCWTGGKTQILNCIFVCLDMIVCK